MTELREKRKEQIILAAIKVFGNYGYYKGTVNKIAEHAGLGKGTIYEYFKSKEEIFEEMLLYILDKYMESITEEINREISSKEKIQNLLDLQFNFFTENKSIVEQTFYRVDNTSSKLREKVKIVHVTIYKIINSIVLDGIEKGEIDEQINKELITMMLMNALNGMNLMDKGPFSNNEKINSKEITKVLFSGIEKK